MVSDVAIGLILLCVFLMLASLSKYLSRLLFAILTGIKGLGSRSVRITRIAEKHLQRPVTYLFASVFVYFGFVLLFQYVENESAVFVGFKNAIAFVTLVLIYLAIIYALIKGATFLAEVQELEYRRASRSPDFAKATTELFSLVLFVLMFIVALLITNAFFFANNDVLLRIVFDLNVITGTLLAGVIPVLRDIVAGLSILSDVPFRLGDSIEVQGVALRGKLIEIGLRAVNIRGEDERVVRVPAGKILAFPVVNYTTNRAQVLELSVQLLHDTSSMAIRNLLVDLETVLFGKLQTSASGVSFQDMFSAGMLDSMKLVDNGETVDVVDVVFDSSELSSIQIEGDQDADSTMYPGLLKSRFGAQYEQRDQELRRTLKLKAQYEGQSQSKLFLDNPSTAQRSFVLVDAKMRLHVRLPFSSTLYHQEKSRVLLLLTEYFEKHKVLTVEV